MITKYSFGPLQAEVESLGKAKPWPGQKKWSFHVTVWDTHGTSFEAGWYSDQDNPAIVAARLIAILWNAANERDFVDEFYGGYRGEEASWRRKEAYRLREAGKKFDDRELTKAAAKANRQMSYESDRGPRDWSPIQEIPLE